MIRLAIAEDNSDLARAISENLKMNDQFELLFVARDGQSLLTHPDLDKVQLVLMDINMPGMTGIETTVKLKKLYPAIKVVMLTVFDDSENIFQSILAGATGYVLKDERTSRLYTAIEEAMEGGAPMSPVIAQKALRLLRGETEPSSNSAERYNLSKRELEILELLAQGFDYNKIADKLFISPKTVRKHIENIYGKLQVHNKVEAITIARRNKLI